MSSAPLWVLVSWPLQRWLVAVAAATDFVLVVAVPTDLIDSRFSAGRPADLVGLALAHRFVGAW